MGDRLRKLGSALRYHPAELRRFVAHPSEREDIRRRYQLALLRRLTPSALVERDGIRYYVSTTDLGVGRDTFVKGSYDADVMAKIIALAEAETGVRPLLAGRTFVDIGANIGTSTIPALLQFGAADAVAFEPIPKTFTLLQCNIAANDLVGRVKTARVALSDETGTGKMELSPDDTGDNRVRVGSASEDGDVPVPRSSEIFFDVESARQTIEIPLVRFDDIAIELGIEIDRIGLVWIDAQGHEAHVLTGAKSILGQDIPVLIEYWPYGLLRADALDRLHEIIASNFDVVVNVRDPAGSNHVAPSDVASLASRYPGRHDFTDLLLLKSPRP